MVPAASSPQLSSRIQYRLTVLDSHTATSDAERSRPGARWVIPVIKAFLLAGPANTITSRSDYLDRSETDDFACPCGQFEHESNQLPAKF